MAAPENFNPHIAFGLQATTIALKAKCRQLVAGHKVDLLMSCLELVPEDEAARNAVIDFINGCKADPAQAAEGLQDYVSKIYPESEPRRPEQVLMNLEAERAEDRDAPEPVQQPEEYDWQRRRDCQ